MTLGMDDVLKVPYKKATVTNRMHSTDLVSNQYTCTLFDSPRFIYSDCGYSPVKTYANKRTLLEEKKWHTVCSNQLALFYISNAFPTELRREICRVGLNLIMYSAI